MGTQDTTLNVMPSTHGNILVSLCDGGFQYLSAGARANVGIKSGRYMFEAKIVELMFPADAPTAKQGITRNMFRIGFSTASSGLFLGEEERNVCFDMDGMLIYKSDKNFEKPYKIKCGSKFGQD